MSKKLCLLIVDDDIQFQDDLRLLLSTEYDCQSADNAETAKGIIDSSDIDVVLLDIHLGTGKDGLTFLRELKTDHPYMPVIMITGDERISLVVNAIKLGASDYVGKKPDLENLRLALEKAIKDVNIVKDRELYRNEINDRWRDIIGSSGPMKKMKEDIKKAAAVKCNVLITGESGTGKELIARAIHSGSPFADLPFIAVNCAAIPKDLFESEMFGHEKGAFTGAITRKIGKFEQAREGTIFLDEISEIPSEQQAKLLRVLQEKRFYRVGGMHEITCEARIIASSNRDLKKSITDGSFREDLYYRIKVFEIESTPLRDRKDDIPELVQYFIRSKAVELKIPVPEITDAAIAALKANKWPGNVRELENSIESALVRCTNNRLEADLFEEYQAVDYNEFSSYEEAKKASLDKFQKQYVKSILRSTGGNVSQAAKKMGISRQGLIKMMKSCGITDQ